MKSRLLDSDWDFTVIGENVYGIPQTPIRTDIPASVYSILMAKGLMPDPFYRDNELTATRLMDNDFRFEKNFTVARDEAKQESYLYYPVKSFISVIVPDNITSSENDAEPADGNNQQTVEKE